MAKWTKEMRLAASRRMKRYHRSKHRQQTQTIDLSEQTRVAALEALHGPTPIPNEVRDIDSIFFRFRRLSRRAQDFVLDAFRGLDARTTQMKLIAQGHTMGGLEDTHPVAGPRPNGAIVTTH